ncbi:MAG TPA: phosphopantetheine-binding protein [Polyangiaceae bacterium]
MITKEELIAGIRCVLEEKMGMQPTSDFSERSRLNEELRLDSVLVLQLLLHLELDMGFQIPEELIAGQHLATVGSLADFLLGLSS